MQSIYRWINLSDEELLFLEGAEDFDIIKEDEAIAVQIKATKKKITLRDKNVIAAINNYWVIRNKNKSYNTHYIYLTTSEIGVEKGDPFGGDRAGLYIWNNIDKYPPAYPSS